ncbi:MAG: hypothetical protein DRO67_01965 [Candidatus Asgardarchaeum californiense]|nr:MAG: hypothetical protein DRO67_01965 [Candidatus Asgardarchaeum californiense]
MNVDDNHLVSPEAYAKMSEYMKQFFEPIPNELSDAAELELMGKEETIVGKDSTGSINTWAEEKRKSKEYLNEIKKLTKRQKNKLHLP